MKPFQDDGLNVGCILLFDVHAWNTFRAVRLYSMGAFDRIFGRDDMPLYFVYSPNGKVIGIQFAHCRILISVLWARKGISLTTFKATFSTFRSKHSLFQFKYFWLREVKGQLIMQCLLRDWTRTFFLSWTMVSHLLSLCLLTGAAY